MMNDSTSGPRAGRPARAVWVTPIQVALLGFVALLCGFVATAYWPQTAARAQGRGGFPGGPPGPGGFGGMQQERKILAQFDKDKNKRLEPRRAKGRARVARHAADVRSWRQARRAWLRGAASRRPSPGKRLSPADVKSYPAAAALRSRDAAHDLPPVRGSRLGAGAGRLQQHRRRRAGDGHRRRQDLQGRRRALPRHVVVLHGPGGSKRSLNLSFDFAHDKQALGGYRTLNLLNANGDPTFVRAVLYSEIARDYIPAPRINYMRVGDQRRELGHLSERAAVQQGFPARQLRRPRRAPAGRCRAARAAAAGWNTSATMSRSTSASTRSRRRTIRRPGRI